MQINLEPRISVGDSGEPVILNIGELRDFTEKMTLRCPDASDAKNLAECRSELRLMKAAVDNCIYTLRKTDDDRAKPALHALAALSGDVDRQLLRLKEISTGSKSGTPDEYRSLFDEISSPLGTFADDVWNSPAFFEKRWVNPKVTPKTRRVEMTEKIKRVSGELTALCADNGEYSAALLDRYLSTLSTSGLSDYRERLKSLDKSSEEAREVIAGLPEPPSEEPVGYKVIKLTGTAKRIRLMLDQLKLMGGTWKLVEDGMPKEPSPVAGTDFDDFVAVDIETSGSLGVSLGDGRPEITEIGAVRVRGGKITDSFSELCDPGRKIVPAVTELTGITNEMVAGKPAITEVMRRFLEFAGSDILLGHGIANSDMPYLKRAAAMAGVRFENRYFDTFRYAERLKDEFSLGSLKLGALATTLGVEHSREHRALDDAETSAKVFFALRKLGS